MASPVYADTAVAETTLRPRIEAGARAGTERSIGMTEIWVPVSQGRDRVLYGDARLNADDQDNNEGNFGIGYRQMAGADLILGAHGWLDRRSTERGGIFNQMTFGVEALGYNTDMRVNAYFPLSDERTYVTQNSGRADPYLAGSGLFYDTSGALVEKPQGGFDIELGHRLPVFEDHIDSMRAYAGIYRFAAADTDTVQGGRIRVAADVTPWLQIGTRYQYDKERGSQAFLEATLRLPGKSSFRKEGVRSRLDESPERDIDIVTSSKVTDTGLAKPVLNEETGTPERILYVDNTNVHEGDGTKENPYNTLKAAEAAMQPYDVVYIRRGDGTAARQNEGIVIDKPGVRLIGSGVDLVLEGTQITGAVSAAGSQTVLIESTAAPVIANTETYVDNYTGNGVMIRSDGAYVSGLTVQGSTGDGIKVFADGAGDAIDDVRIENVKTFLNGKIGVAVLATNGSTIGDVSISEVESRSNTGSSVRAEAMAGSYIGSLDMSGLRTSNAGGSSSGIVVITRTSGRIGSAVISDAESDSNPINGIIVTAQGGGTINYAALSDFRTDSNTQAGVKFEATGANSVLAEAVMSDGSASDNIARGLVVTANTTARIGTVTLDNLDAINNTDFGVYLQANNANSRIDQAIIQDITATGNTTEGLRVETNNGGTSIAGSIKGVLAENNGRRGVQIYAQNAGATSFTLQNVTATGNADQGVIVLAQSSGQTTATLSDIVATGNAQNGVLVQAASSGIISAALSHVTATGNTVHGVFIDDDTTAAFNADLGGGTLGSTGSNRIYGDTGTDLHVDLDGGQLKAENNWWGNAAGLQAGERTLDVGSTVDASPFLAADPGL